MNQNLTYTIEKIVAARLKEQLLKGRHDWWLLDRPQLEAMMEKNVRDKDWIDVAVIAGMLHWLSDAREISQGIVLSMGEQAEFYRALANGESK